MVSFWNLLPEQKACPEPAEGASPAGAKPGNTEQHVDIKVRAIRNSKKRVHLYHGEKSLPFGSSTISVPPIIGWSSQ